MAISRVGFEVFSAVSAGEGERPVSNPSGDLRSTVER
jgi:hypothetical protein